MSFKWDDQMVRSDVAVMISSEAIQGRVKELGEQITRDYAQKDVLVIGLLNGVYVFFADLTRSMDLDAEIAFMRLGSYGSGTESSGAVKLIQDLDKPIKGRHVLVVEDIIDTGLTLQRVTALLQERNPASLKICTLLDKPSRRKVQIKADYTGFSIDDHFVVGYGLDMNGKYRNLPYVGVYNPA